MARREGQSTFEESRKGDQLPPPITPRAAFLSPPYCFAWPLRENSLPCANVGSEFRSHFRKAILAKLLATAAFRLSVGNFWLAPLIFDPAANFDFDVFYYPSMVLNDPGFVGGYILGRARSVSKRAGFVKRVRERSERRVNGVVKKG